MTNLILQLGKSSGEFILFAVKLCFPLLVSRRKHAQLVPRGRMSVSDHVI